MKVWGAFHKCTVSFVGTNFLTDKNANGKVKFFLILNIIIFVINYCIDFIIFGNKILIYVITENCPYPQNCY